MTAEFEMFLESKNVELDKEITDEGVIYHGLFEVDSTLDVNFGIMLLKSEDPWINYQVVFNHLGYCQDYGDKDKVIRFINSVNLQGQGYYYLFINSNDTIALRTIACAKDYDTVYSVFLAGAKTAQSVRRKLLATTQMEEVV